MTETQIIKKIKKLKAIRPRSDWVLLNKRQILGEERRVELFPFLRPVYAGLFCLLFLVGLFEFSQESLPGDSLYYLKKITEKSQMIFSSEEERPRIKLELVNKRLEELDQIAQENEVGKLAPALKEYRISVSEVKNLERAMSTTSDWMVVKEIIKNEEQLQTEYGVVLGEVSKEESGFIPLWEQVKQEVERSIEYLKERSLNEEDKALFEEAEKYYEEGNYNESWEKILDLSQN